MRTGTAVTALLATGLGVHVYNNPEIIQELRQNAASFEYTGPVAEQPSAENGQTAEPSVPLYQSTMTAEGKVLLDPASLPRELPEPVARMTKNIVKIYLDGGNPTTTEDDGIGSGVALTDRLVLTAGHVLLDETTDQLKPGYEQCGQVRVYAGSDAQSGAYPSGAPQYGSSVNVLRVTGIEQVSADRQRQESDLALLELAEPLPRSLEGVRLAGFTSTLDEPSLYAGTTIPLQRPAAGQPVFFMGYGPTRGTDRNPDERRISETGKSQGFSSPAQSAALALQQTTEGHIPVMTGIWSYDPLYDTYPRGGDSGGGIFMEDGTLLGVVSYGHDRGPDQYGQNIADKYNLAITDQWGRQQVGEDFIQPTDPQLIGSFAARLSAAPVCHG